VSDDTRAIALEAAWWDPLSIRRASKAVGLHTEASHRFERGADPEATVVALARIAHLLEKIGAGSARPGLIDRVAAPARRRTLALRPSRLEVVLGVPVPAPKAGAILLGLGFGVGSGAGDELAIEVPSWRSDVGREADLVEEVGRHFGLDKVPSSIPPTDGMGRLGRGQAEERAVRATLVAAGLTEAITPAFVREVPGGSAVGSVGFVALENPLAAAQSVLRSSLLLPGLFDVLDANLRQGRRDIALFEIGRVFHPGPELPVEEQRLAILLAGQFRGGHWSEKPRAADFFDLKGLVERLFERLGQPAPAFRRDGLPEWLHPGRGAALLHGGKALGWLGAMRPGFREEPAEVLVAELALEPLLAEPASLVRFAALKHFPAVERDLSVLTDAGTSAAEIEARIRRAAGPLLVAVAVADRYDRPPVPEGRVSLTLGLRYQHAERTLTGEEVQSSVDGVIRDLRAAGLEIRGQ
jgi:phenylalanyl-tRNA synthetase beta chain